MQFKKYRIFDKFTLLCYFIFYHISIANSLIGPFVTPAGEGEFPFVVAIVEKRINEFGEQDLICTASLFSPRDIITAQHCFTGEGAIDGVEVIVGSNEVTDFPNNGIKWWYSYEQWTKDTGKKYKFSENDISVARLTQDVSSDIRIPKFKFMTREELQGKFLTVTGWGRIGPDIFPILLQKARVEVLSLSECQTSLSELTGGKMFDWGVNQLCSVGRPYAVVTGGDSGSPLLYNNNIVAVNTGTSPPTTDLNIVPETLNMHLNVYFYKKFLTSVINRQ